MGCNVGVICPQVGGCRGLVPASFVSEVSGRCEGSIASFSEVSVLRVRLYILTHCSSGYGWVMYFP